MTGPRAGVDPDIEQAIDDLLPIAAELQAAKDRAARLAPSATLRQSGEAKHRVGDLRGIIGTRAGRIGTTTEGLLVILAIEGRMRRTMRGKPSPLAVEREIEAALTARQAELAPAEKALIEVDEAVAHAEVRAAKTKRIGKAELAAAQAVLAVAKPAAERAARRVVAAREALRAYRGVEQARAA